MGSEKRRGNGDIPELGAPPVVRSKPPENEATSSDSLFGSATFDADFAGGSLDLALDDGPDRIDFGGTICLAIASADGVESRRSRILGGREWVRLGATEMGLDCLRRYLQGLPVAERIDFEKT